MNADILRIFYFQENNDQFRGIRLKLQTCINLHLVLVIFTKFENLFIWYKNIISLVKPTIKQIYMIFITNTKYKIKSKINDFIDKSSWHVWSLSWYSNDNFILHWIASRNPKNDIKMVIKCQTTCHSLHSLDFNMHFSYSWILSSIKICKNVIQNIIII